MSARVSNRWFYTRYSVLGVMALTATFAHAATPPPSGMSSCAGKIEGRYAGDQQGTITLVFHQGQATMLDMIGGRQVLQCFTNGKQIILREAGKPENDMPIDINNDGTLQVPVWGVLRKKGD